MSRLLGASAATAAVISLSGGSNLASASLAPIVVKQGTTMLPGVLGDVAFPVGRKVECRTFGRLLVVRVPARGETKVQFRTSSGQKIWLYLVHLPAATTVWCGAADSFGGH
jgi:hypothetical protein